MNAHIETTNLISIQTQLHEKSWLVACLCAAWCDTCNAYRKDFDELAKRHPDKCFAWIDIEDHAELVDEIDIENFPTLLIQHNDDVAFLGTMLPDISQLNRLLGSLSENQTPLKRSSLNEQAPQGWSLRRLIAHHPATK